MAKIYDIVLLLKEVSHGGEGTNMCKINSKIPKIILDEEN